MPFLRYTRDRRGYETTYLMHGYRSGQGPGQTRILYFFRSPAHVRVGRRPFDEEAREALEHTHPDLAFDWTALGREPAPHHFEERDRGGQNARRGGRPQPSRTAPMVSDETLLGRVLGPGEAARLRTRYQELLQRILRRAATPEDRSRLMARMERLNPDGWADEATVRAAVPTIEAAWDEIRRELPSRRRGGRRQDDRRRPDPGREPETAAAGEADVEAGADPSAIIEPQRGDEADAQGDVREGAGADDRAAAPRDGNAVGGAAADDAAGNDFPGGE